MFTTRLVILSKKKTLTIIAPTKNKYLKKSVNEKYKQNIHIKYYYR